MIFHLRHCLALAISWNILSPISPRWLCFVLFPHIISLPSFSHWIGLASIPRFRCGSFLPRIPLIRLQCGFGLCSLAFPTCLATLLHVIALRCSPDRVSLCSLAFPPCLATLLHDIALRRSPRGRISLCSLAFSTCLATLLHVIALRCSPRDRISLCSLAFP